MFAFGAARCSKASGYVQSTFVWAKAGGKVFRYLRRHAQKITDLGQLKAFNMNGRHAYRLEDLEAYVESLPGWYDSTAEKSAKVVGDRRIS